MRVVLLPGLNGSSTLFGPLLAHLHPTLDVQVLELPAQGSQKPENLADQLLDELGKTPYVLLGESFSGPLAYQLALRQPPGLRGVIFAASFLSRPHPLLPLARHLPLPRWLLKHKTLLRLFCLNGQANAERVQALRAEIHKLPQSLLRAACIASANYINQTCSLSCQRCNCGRIRIAWSRARLRPACRLAVCS